MDLEPIKARLEAATPGPWPLRDPWYGDEGTIVAVGPSHNADQDAPGENEQCEDEGCQPGCPHDLAANADQALIANAPTDITALIAEVEALREWQAKAVPLLLASMIFAEGTQVEIPLANLIDQAQAQGVEVV